MIKICKTILNDNLTKQMVDTCWNPFAVPKADSKLLMSAKVFKYQSEGSNHKTIVKKKSFRTLREVKVECFGDLSKRLLQRKG